MRDSEPDAGAGTGRGAWRSRNVVLLGLVSLLTDTATEIVIPLLPAFLTGTLGAGALALGWIEGGADAVASVFKLLSGRWADRMGRNRPLVVAGYALSSVVRPFVAAAGSAWHVLAVRLADRTGKGLRSSPRDALIALSVPAHERAAAFGLHRAMDHAGAVLGPLIAAAYLAWSTTDDLRPLFWLTAIPGAAAVAVLVLGVREAPRPRPAVAPEPERAPAHDDAPRAPRHALWRVLLPLTLFTLGNASDVFLLLKAGAERAPLAALPLLWLALHVVKALASIPCGRLADRWGRRRAIALGWVVYALVYVGFGLAQGPTAVAFLFVVYGFFHALTEGAERALVAELAPASRLGTAFGLYHLVLGLAALAASVLFGALWDAFGARTAFFTSAALALAATLALAALAPRPQRA